MINSNHGSLENTILNAVWFMEENEQDIISVSDVLERINIVSNQKWAYTTVKTVMDRLVEKGIINRIKNGKKYFYRSVYSREEMGRRSIEKIARQFYNNDIDALMKAVEAIRAEVMVLA